MSLNAQNIDDPKKNNGWYQYGVQYSDKIPSTVGFIKSDPNALKANHGAWGNPTSPDSQKIKSAMVALLEQEKRRKKEYKKKGMSPLEQAIDIIKNPVVIKKDGTP